MVELQRFHRLHGVTRVARDGRGAGLARGGSLEPCPVLLLQDSSLGRLYIRDAPRWPAVPTRNPERLLLVADPAPGLIPFAADVCPACPAARGPPRRASVSPRTRGGDLRPAASTRRPPAPGRDPGGHGSAKAIASSGCSSRGCGRTGDGPSRSSRPRPLSAGTAARLRSPGHGRHVADGQAGPQSPPTSAR